MKYFALWGKEKIGKTTVIKKVCGLIEKENYSSIFSIDYSEDILSIYKINDKTIGITSYGDDADVLKEPLKKFEEYKCDIILTASRIRYTKKGSALAIYNFCETYGIKPFWIKKII